jgi:hypothetical protein
MTSATRAIENTSAIRNFGSGSDDGSLIHCSVADVATIHPQVPGRHACHALFDHARVAPNRESPLLLKVGEHEATADGAFIRHGSAIHADRLAPIAGYAEPGNSDRPAAERDLVVTILELDDPGARFSEPRHPRTSPPSNSTRLSVPARRPCGPDSRCWETGGPECRFGS